MKLKLLTLLAVPFFAIGMIGCAENGGGDAEEAAEETAEAAEEAADEAEDAVE